MPKRPIKNKCKNDKFFTKPEVARTCVKFLQELVNTDDYLKIEPSAGSGNFSSLLPCLAMDLHPDGDDIVSQDFLEWCPESIPDKTLMFGNPPFGNANSKSKAFIRKGISLGVKTIAFILPNTFKKHTTQKVFPPDWRLIGELQLPNESFIFDDKGYHVPCTFQIWSCIEEGQDLREAEGKESTDAFKFVGKDENPTAFVFGAAPTKILTPSEVSKNNRGYYLTTSLPFDKFKSKLSAIDWSYYGNSSVSGGVAWFTKSEIVKVWEEHYGSEQSFT